MTGDNKIMLALFVMGLIVLFTYFLTEFITYKKKQKKRAQARYKAYKITRRATATEYAKQMQLAYLTALLGGKQ